MKKNKLTLFFNLSCQFRCDQKICENKIREKFKPRVVHDNVDDFILLVVVNAAPNILCLVDDDVAVEGRELLDSVAAGGFCTSGGY